ncbi:hypothetical protein ACFS5L_03200 [Streptomyces phyllanthi]|nr:hypothetical protein [Streptomyces phyllanthi]
MARDMVMDMGRDDTRDPAERDTVDLVHLPEAADYSAALRERTGISRAG